MTASSAPVASVRDISKTFGQRKALNGVSVEVAAGEMVALIGPSGSGKSTLSRVLVGAWPAAGGKVRLDGASLDQWDREALGRHIGYLPQGVELFDGTIADNIARFEEDADPDAIFAAAEAEENVQRAIGGKPIRKRIHVPGRVVNLVV